MNKTNKCKQQIVKRTEKTATICIQSPGNIDRSTINVSNIQKRKEKWSQFAIQNQTIRKIL